MKFSRLSFTLSFIWFSVAMLRAQTPYKIPVVVHVIHADGTENLSEAQIKNGIGVLTRNWRKLNPDTSEIMPVFKPIAADMEVEFELAKLDPEGNCTNGINRIRSEFTVTGTHNVKTLIHWPREKYLNVYVVRNAAGLAGHALMPFQADSLPGWDGIVISGSYFGNIGTSNDLKSVVLSHEVGHYLNLYHIWGGNNVPDFYYLPVGQAANCAVGDSVADTPPTTGWSTCNLNGNSCDTALDNVQNFMDYAYCARMFTQGQKQRVHAALNSSVAQRNQLWTSSNLAQTGLSVDAPLCRADFYTPRRTYCVGETVTFFDASYHDPISWTWNLGSGSPLTVANPTYAYAASGKYDVELTVSDGTENQAIERQHYLKIVETTGLALPYIEGFETLTDLAASPLFTECEGALCYELNTAVSASGQKCIHIRNGQGESALLYRLTTPRLDFSQTPDPVLRFRYAFAPKDTANSDKLLVRTSTDCGASWQTRKTINAVDLPTVANSVSGIFVPQAADWKEVLITTLPSTGNMNNLLVRFEFYSGGGNDFYLDDINIFDESQLSMPTWEEADWYIAPNPTADVFRVEGPFPYQSVELFGMDGKCVQTHLQTATGTAVDVAGLPAGWYWIKLGYQGAVAYRKLAVLAP